MEARAKDVLRELIGENKSQFVIPVFQRNYNWQKKECERLFKDIEGLADADQSKRHFIGAFVYKFNKFVDTQYNEFVLIDGQQRMTSSMLLLKALIEVFKDYGDKYEDTIKEITVTYLINQFAKDSKLRLKLKANKTDQNNFDLLLNDRFDLIDKESNIYKNYSYFCEQLRKTSIGLDKFYNALQRLECIGVMIDQKDDPQVIFESLNSTGLELTDLDLIRNYLLMNIHSEKQEEYYSNYWLKIEKTLGDDSFLSFIRDYLTFKKGSTISRDNHGIYFSFKKYFEDNITSTYLETFLDELVRYSNVYSRLINGNADLDALSISLNNYKELKMGTTYPFILGILIDVYVNERIANIEASQIIKAIESYVIRRNICNIQGGVLSNIMASLYNQMMRQYGDKFFEKTSKKIESALIGIKTKGYFPKDDEFEKNFLENNLYDNKNIEYILYRIESQYHNKELVQFSNLSIEHVLPQTITNTNWEVSLGITNDDEKHSIYKNRIGNLTLTAYNSEMKNKPFNQKKEHIDFSVLAINQYFKTKDSWSLNDIDVRGSVLFDIVKKIWFYPSVKPSEVGLYNEVFLFDEGYSFVSTNPRAIKIKNDELTGDTWALILANVIEYFYKMNSERIISLLGNSYLNSTKPLISKRDSDFIASYPLSDGWYINTNSPTDRKIEILRHLCKEFDIDETDAILLMS